ncbi:MAG: hypothetical protein JNJ53_02765 [Rhizobiales bacterium]|nr:hypothetical protein [Hyphomicrobiales bacterium]
MSGLDVWPGETVDPGGLEVRHDVGVDVSILAPHVTYPKHNHPPDEIYAVLYCLWVN